MSSFAIKHPFFILMMCLVVIVVGATTVARMREWVSNSAK